MKHDAGVLGTGGAWRRSRAGKRGQALLAGLALVTSFSPTRAFAQPAASAEEVFEQEAETPSPSEATDQAGRLGLAREAFLEGRQLMAQAKWTEAALAFERAISAHSTPGLHYHLGLCLEQGGDALRARQAYLDAQKLLEEQTAPDVAALLPAAILRVENRLSRFELAIEPARAAVWIDDLAVVDAPPEWLAAGTHWLHAEAEGYEPLDRRFQVKAGTPTRLDVALRSTADLPQPAVPVVPPPSVAPAPPPAPVRHSALPRTVFWGSVAFAALGTAAGVAGVIWHVDASTRVGEAQARLDDQGQTGESACYGPVAEAGEACQELRAAVSAEESAAILLVGGFAAAGVGVLGALGSWAIWPREKFALAGRMGFGSVRIEVRGSF